MPKRHGTDRPKMAVVSSGSRSNSSLPKSLMSQSVIQQPFSWDGAHQDAATGTKRDDGKRKEDVGGGELEAELLRLSEDFGQHVMATTFDGINGDKPSLSSHSKQRQLASHAAQPKLSVDLGAFLLRQGVAHCLEDGLKELTINRPFDGPPGLNALPGFALSDSSPYAASPDVSVPTVLPPELGPAPLRFLADWLSLRIISSQGNSFRRAVQLITGCNPCSGGTLLDNAAEAFLLLAQQSAATSRSNNGPGFDLNNATVHAGNANEFLATICAAFPANILDVLLPLVQSNPAQPYGVSFNDFMCALNPCLALKHLLCCAGDEFTRVDQDEDGLVTVAEAMDGLRRFSWAETNSRRRQTIVLGQQQMSTSQSSQRNEDSNFSAPINERNAWQGSSRQVMGALPACPEQAAKNSTLLLEAQARLEEYATANNKAAQHKITRTQFVETVAIGLSPLGHYSKTWMLV